MHLSEKYQAVRQLSREICKPLQTEDYVVQPVADTSPPKWHLGHSTWFFETFVLLPWLRDYQVFNEGYNFVFNSYYETVGARVIRTDRGNLSRPTVADVYRYREHVDAAMHTLLGGTVGRELAETVILGCHHEQQHQELLLSDIKYILGHNPLFPAYADGAPGLAGVGPSASAAQRDDPWIGIGKGLYEIGYQPDGSWDGFCFDNELTRHPEYLCDFKIASALVTNGEYMEFIREGCYHDFRYWHAEGWDWVKNNQVKSPLYWHHVDGEWYCYGLNGLSPLDLREPVCHVSFYEASAYAAWKGCRLPTEFEWEAAAGELNWGRRWEWTESAYLPYPGFRKAGGAIGEYNGKFMVNQKVLRGASDITPAGHSRPSYRNFFHPPLRWQYTGIRLAQ
jgi:ergothioneine biosynthesis protein EgtB